MVEGNASMYLGSPRLAEMVVGEKATLEEMGGARMHATVSGCGDNLAVDDADAIAQAALYLSYLPENFFDDPPVYEPVAPETPFDAVGAPREGERGLRHSRRHQRVWSTPDRSSRSSRCSRPSW